MQIKEVATVKLKPYENNPRKNDEAVDVVANSIKEFGFKVPIVIDSNNEIICGHTRLKAAVKLGMKVVPCITAEDLTEEQIKAFRLVDNKTAELAQWDYSKLDEELAKIKNIDMSNLGFEGVDDEEIDELFEESPKKPPKPKECVPIICPYCGTKFDMNSLDIIEEPENGNN